MTRIEPGDPPAALLEIPEQQFASLVELEVKGRLDADIASKLRNAQVAQRWYNALVGMKRTAEGVVQARRLESKAKRREILMRSEQAVDEAERKRLRAEAEQELISFERWQVNTVRFLTSVEERLTSAREYMDAPSASPASRLELLEQAIREHASTIDPEDATEYDVRLWSTVDFESSDPNEG